MKRKLLNPYAKDENYNCFGCSPKNKNGLQLTFVEDGEYITAEWNPNNDFQGYYNILHGGIQATMLDEIACWCVNVKAKSAGLTTNMNIKYRSSVFMNEGTIKLRAKLITVNSRLVTVHAELLTAKGKIGAEADVTYITFHENVGKQLLSWPGVEAFYE